MQFSSIDFHPAVDDSLSATTKSSSSSPKPSPSKGILKGSSKDHTIILTDSEIAPLKPKLSWDQSVLEGSHEQPRRINVESVSASNGIRADRKIIFESQKIEKWAADLAAQKQRQLQEVNKALAYIKKNPIALLLKTQKQLKEWHAIISDQYIKAQKYATWTNYRTEILQGNDDLQQALERTGQTIDKEWTKEDLQDDWEVTKQEPWAQENPAYDELKKIITSLCVQHQEMEKAKAKIQSFDSDVKKSFQKKAEDRHAVTSTPSRKPAQKTSEDSSLEDNRSKTSAESWTDLYRYSPTRHADWIDASDIDPRCDMHGQRYDQRRGFSDDGGFNIS